MAIQAQSYQQTPSSWYPSQDSRLDQQQRLIMMHLQPKNQNHPHNQQEMGVDQLLQLQTEKLKVALQEQMKQHTGALLKTLQSKTKFILNQKDQELAAARQRTAELQSLMQKLETEGHAWRRAAQENEAVVASLNNTLEELSRDRESHCDGAAGDNQVRADTDMCKSCNAQGSCMLFLPCRHLCSCKTCEPLLGNCPVCQSPKKATMEALMF